MSVEWDTKNKCWCYRFDRRIQGRRIRVGKLLPKGWTQAKADAFDRKESQRLYEVATGLQRRDPLIDEAVNLYLADKTALKSFKATADHLNQIASFYFGRRMSELPQVSEEITKHRDSEREGRTISPATIRNRLACLKAACRWAWKRHGIVDADPTARMLMPAVSNDRHVYLQRKGMLTVARAADRHDLCIAIRVAFYTGMRLGELQRVTVRGNVLELQDTKNGDRRAIPAHPRIRTCLPYLPLAAPKITLQRAWQRARAATGIGDVHFHDLRHSAASEMVNAGVDLYTVGTVLGHRDARSTKRYSHLRTDRLADAIGAIGKREPGQICPRPAAQKGKKKATKKAA